MPRGTHITSDRREPLNPADGLERLAIFERCTIPPLISDVAAQLASLS